MLGRGVKAALVGAAVLLLVGCSEVSPAYVTVDGGVFTLTIPSNCSSKITDVIVKYSRDDGTSFDELTTVWSAEVDPGHVANEVILFQPNDGFSTERSVLAIDTSKELVVSWSEQTESGTVFVGDLVGVLDDVGDEDVLWNDGITTRDTYDGEVSAPWGQFRC